MVYEQNATLERLIQEILKTEEFQENVPNDFLNLSFDEQLNTLDIRDKLDAIWNECSSQIEAVNKSQQKINDINYIQQKDLKAEQRKLIQREIEIEELIRQKEKNLQSVKNRGINRWINLTGKRLEGQLAEERKTLDGLKEKLKEIEESKEGVREKLANPKEHEELFLSKRRADGALQEKILPELKQAINQLLLRESYVITPIQI